MNIKTVSLSVSTIFIYLVAGFLTYKGYMERYVYIIDLLGILVLIFESFYCIFSIYKKEVIVKYHKLNMVEYYVYNVLLAPIVIVLIFISTNDQQPRSYAAYISYCSLVMMIIRNIILYKRGES